MVSDTVASKPPVTILVAASVLSTISVSAAVSRFLFRVLIVVFGRCFGVWALVTPLRFRIHFLLPFRLRFWLGSGSVLVTVLVSVTFRLVTVSVTVSVSILVKLRPRFQFGFDYRLWMRLRFRLDCFAFGSAPV